MNLYAAPFFILGLFSLPLSSCMMAMDGMGHGASHQMQGRAKMVEKEIPEKDTRLSLDVPSLPAGDEATMVLTASRIQDGAPIIGAKVVFLFERVQESGTEHAEHHVTTVAEREAEEVTGKGVYQLGYRYGESGLYRITAFVWADKKEGTAPPLTVSLTQVASQQERHEGNNASDTMLVIGAVGMALMMVIMLF